MSGPPQPCVLRGPADELLLFSETQTIGRRIMAFREAQPFRRCVSEAAVNYKAAKLFPVGRQFARAPGHRPGPPRGHGIAGHFAVFDFPRKTVGLRAER